MKGEITIKTELKEIKEEVKYHALIEDIMFKFIFGYPKKYLLDKGYYFLVINIDDMKELEYNLIKEVKELIGLNIYEEENHQEKLKRLLKFMGEKDEEKALKIIKKDRVLKNMYETMKEFIDGEYSKGYFSAKRFHIGMGIEEGREQNKIDTAINMLKENCDISLISKVTKLPIKEIKKLAKEIKNN